MKTKNMRKKALLSSVAMLLVAVVALSGATYAWFSSNTAASASGISLKTGTQSSLLFGDAASDGTTDTTKGAADPDVVTDWTATYELDATLTTLQPVSSNDASTFFAVTTTERGATEGATIASTIGAPGAGVVYQWSQKFLVMSSEVAHLYVRSITATGSTLAPIVRVAVKYDGGAAKIFTVNGATRTNTAITAVDGYDSSTAAGQLTLNDLYGTTTESISACSAKGVTKVAQNITALPCALTTYVENETDTRLPVNTPKVVEVIVWLEGNDSACVNALMGATINNFTINFGTTAS